MQIVEIDRPARKGVLRLHLVEAVLDFAKIDDMSPQVIIRVG